MRKPGWGIEALTKLRAGVPRVEPAVRIREIRGFGMDRLPIPPPLLCTLTVAARLRRAIANPTRCRGTIRER
jgi:hypothetical protein